jgi:hypothetical protein
MMRTWTTKITRIPGGMKRVMMKVSTTTSKIVVTTAMEVNDHVVDLVEEANKECSHVQVVPARDKTRDYGDPAGVVLAIVEIMKDNPGTSETRVGNSPKAETTIVMEAMITGTRVVIEIVVLEGLPDRAIITKTGIIERV